MTRESRCTLAFVRYICLMILMLTYAIFSEIAESVIVSLIMVGISVTSGSLAVWYLHVAYTLIQEINHDRLQ